MWVIPEDLGNFSPKKGEKSLGAKNSRLSASNFRESFLVISYNFIFCICQMRLFYLTNEQFIPIECEIWSIFKCK
jgi:hypothetical protein